MTRKTVWLAIALTAAVALLLTACGGGPKDVSWGDDFSDPESGWLAESDSSAEVGYQDGVMRVFVKAPNRLAWASAGRELADFHLAVEATQVSGPDDNEYGVLARMSDPDHFYCFSISGDGYYQVSKYEAGTRTPLAGDWTPSDAINTGAATNILEVNCNGAMLTFVVNGVQVAQVEDDTYSKGDIGLYAGAFFDPDVEVYFDNLSITTAD